jgi:hypothetical protein
MNMSKIVNRARIWLRVISWPAALAHELTHLIIALPWSRQSAIVFDGKGGASAQIQWADDAPVWAIWISYRAPLLLGSAVGLAGLMQLALTGLTTSPLVAAAIAAYWIIYVTPSKADLQING